MANRTRTQLSTDSLGFFPNNNSQLISPQDLRDWITNGIESFVTQKDTSTFENAFYECQSSPITATSGTTNLALATGNFVHITGSGSISITSFGTLPAGSRFVLCFDIAVTLVYNATTMILPGAANIVTAPGDSVMIISEGGGNWRLIGYFPSSGLPVGTVTAVTATTPLSSTGGNAPDISISQANGSTDGFLSSTDWNTFNNKGNGTVTSVTGTAPIASTGGTTPAISIPKADASTDGYLDNADWSAFNSKQPAGNYITGLTGDVTASGPGSVAATIANDAVTTAKILNNNVTYGKIQNASGSSLLLGSNASGTGITEITLGTNLSMTGSTLNATGGGGGGSPGGANGDFQYKNGSAFAGGTGLKYQGGFVTIDSPKIGTSTTTGHFHMHRVGTVPTGIVDYLTMFWDRTLRAIGFKHENESFVSQVAFTQPTADRTYTLPDATGNVVIDTVLPVLNNGTNAGEIRLKEATANGNDYISLKAPSAITTGSSYTLTFPNVNPGSGQTLISDAVGQLSWSSNPGTTNQQYRRIFGGTFTGNANTEILVQDLLIPANTFSSNNGFKILAGFSRTLPTGNAVTARIYINTTSSAIGGVNLTGNSFLLAANTGQYISLSRSGYIQVGSGVSRNTIFGSANTANNSVYTNENGAFVQLVQSPIDWSIDQYVILTVSQNNALGTITCNNLQIMPQ